MDNYFINKETLLLIPINLKETIVTEINNKFIVKKNVMNIVNDSCCYFGSNYEGRYQGSKNILNMSYKLPIIIEDFNELVIFPTCSSRQENCCWLMLCNIENYKKNEAKTIVEFKNNIEIELDISYGSFENQVFRATMLLSKIKKRKKVSF